MRKKSISTKNTPRKSNSGKRRKSENVLLTVEQAAYFKAERDGFQGDPLFYWLAAEAEINTATAKNN